MLNRCSHDFQVDFVKNVKNTIYYNLMKFETNSNLGLTGLITFQN